MQALVKEGGGGDHISVGVKLPNKKYERPIQNANLFTGPDGKLHSWVARLPSSFTNQLNL